MELEEKPKLKTRRQFLINLLMGGGLLASAALLVRHGIAFIFPKAEPPISRKLLIGRVGELKVGEAKEFQIGDRDLYFVNTADDYKVFSSICTHLGCKVRWEAHRNRFYCSCHQGVFGNDGKVLEGPPPRALDEFKVQVDNNLVYMWIEEKRRGML